MKTLSILSAACGVVFMGAASAANITVYYSPTCPHCHHARDFIENTLIYEYPQLTVTEIDVMNGENLPLFQDALAKCEYESGGVPVLVIGEKCFQGYADSMQDELRDAVAVDLSDEDKAVAAENKKAMEENADAFKQEHADRLNAISEYKKPESTSESAEPVAENSDAAPQQNNEAAKPAGSSSIWFYALLVALVAALGFVLVGTGKKKK